MKKYCSFIGECESEKTAIANKMWQKEDKKKNVWSEQRKRKKERKNIK